MNHFHPNTEFMCASYIPFVQLTEEERLPLMSIIQGSANISFIRTLMNNNFELILNEGIIEISSKELIQKNLDDIGVDPNASRKIIFKK